jgi:hypothetical protein
MVNHNKKIGSSTKSFIVGVFFLALGVLPSLNSEIYSRNNLTNDEVSTIMKNIVAAFGLAETKILKVKPDIPDDTPEGPHPDVDKCVCRGTGKITHGDGHQTDCPYHGKDVPDPESKRCKCDTDSTYCNCVKVHGKCSCEKKNEKDFKLWTKVKTLYFYLKYSGRKKNGEN